jgi:uncharacterized membrane protein YgcG
MIRRLLLMVLLLVPAAVAAQDTGWEITAFDAAYTVNRDGTIDVVERIAVNFNDLQRRGIFREIPIRYLRADGQGRETVDIALRGVSNDRGEALQTQVTRGDNARIRIGDPDVTVTGRQVYVISYTIARGVGFFEHHDELYWQVTGTEWPVPILNATARVTIPDGGNAADTAWTAWCYAGTSTSTANDRCTAEVVPGTEWRFSAERLEAGEGLTLVAGFPKGIIPPPTPMDEAKRTGATWWPMAMPFLAFLAMYRTWRARGREPHSGSVVPRWRIPEGMRPGIGGTLHDQSADLDDVIATLLDLAVRGYVKIVEVKPPNPFEDLGGGFLGKALKKLGDRKPGWAIERTDKPTTDLVASEREVLEAILEGGARREMSELRNKFHAKLPGLYRAFYQETVQEGLFVKSPEKVRTRWMLVGVALIILGILASVILVNVILAIAAGLSGIVVIGFARAMPQMTPRGARMYGEVRGLEEYIRRAEKLELEMHQGPKRTTELFSTLLPYAIALDASDVWVDQFADALTSQPPTWYVGSSPHFTGNAFRSSIQSFTSSVASTMASTPGSSSGGGGGGSVGGGGGGGGGGSW